MDKKIIGIVIPIFVVFIAALMFISPSSDISNQKTNEKIGLVINSPSSSISLQGIDEIFTDASSSGIGRNNVYLFWNIIEPVEGNFDWSQSDIIMGLNEKNDLKVTLFFSIINGNTLGPFPNWIGKPTLLLINEDELVNTLDKILSRYHIVDSVIIAGETESQFRFKEYIILIYQELFSNVYDKIKEKHPDVQFGNSFSLNQVLNKNLEHIVTDLAIGDFVAFSYAPTDLVNEIVKTPKEAIYDLNKIFEIVPNKKIGFFEISWSTSELINGDYLNQQTFLKKLFNFYTENEPKIGFLTWYRYSDQQVSTCATEHQKIGDKMITVGGGSSFGTSEHVIERLNQYNCHAGLVDIDQNYKIGWNEFKTQIQMLN
jgi:hypothetical protein